MRIEKPRGTNDLYGDKLDNFNYIVDTLKKVAQKYNYSEIVTPIFESKELFVRNVGSTTDIVTKEFYDFKDKGNREMALRPEGTVAVIRSVVENKLIFNSYNQSLKLFYVGPMFRYERPQNGRSRQFNQFGIENIGIKSEFNQIEIILMIIQMLKELNIKQYELKINYIGNFDTRKKWIDSLNNYFSKFKDQLTADSNNRINKNPLRILDDKVDGKKDFVINAPDINQFLNEKEKQEIDFLLNQFNELKINYKYDKTLVRGLDYYFGFVFEFVSLQKDLDFSTIVGGGKYCKLMSELGADDYDAIGFAIGIERLVRAYELENDFVNKNKLDIYFASFQETKNQAIKIIDNLRNNGFSVECDYSVNKLDKHFKYASRLNPKYILIFGKKELENNKIVIKNQLNNEEKIVDLNSLLNELN